MSDNDLTQQLHDTLTREAHDFHGTGTDLSGVRLRAHRIRRNRRVAVAGGVLAVAAMIVPGVLMAGDVLPDSAPEPPVTTHHPSPDRATDSARPGVPYLEGGTLVLPDGERRELPSKGYDGGAMVGDQFFGMRGNDDTGERMIEVVDADGSVSDSFAIASGLASNAAGDTLAWATPDGGLHLAWAGGQSGSSARGSVLPQVVLGGPDCDTQECAVVANLGPGGAKVFGPAGATVVPDGVLKVNDATEAGLVAAQTQSRPAGSCSAVYEAGAERFTTCKFSLYRFSPQADHVSATDAYQDGVGQPYVSILSAGDGNELVHFAPDNGVVWSATWEDDDHLLATVHADGAWSVVRIGVDGATTRVLGPSAKGDELTPAYVVLGPS